MLMARLRMRIGLGIYTQANHHPRLTETPKQPPRWELMASKLELAKPKMAALFDSIRGGVFTESDLLEILRTHRNRN